jgi:hypothetical protein
MIKITTTYPLAICWPTVNFRRMNYLSVRGAWAPSSKSFTKGTTSSTGSGGSPGRSAVVFR